MGDCKHERIAQGRAVGGVSDTICRDCGRSGLMFLDTPDWGDEVLLPDEKNGRTYHRAIWSQELEDAAYEERQQEKRRRVEVANGITLAKWVRR